MKEQDPVLKFLKVRNVKEPAYATSGAGGIDFFIPNDTEWESHTLWPGETIEIPSGLQVEIPEGYSLILFGRSSKIRKGLLLSPQIIDSDFRGEFHLIATNCSQSHFTISKGDRILQGSLISTPKIKLIQLQDESEFTKTVRGKQGFGHSGK